MQNRIQIVCGPTASGKSAHALAIAQEQRGVIINADAMQVYRELRIVTARPTAQDEALAPHALYGVLPASEACSAARWLVLAVEEIQKTWQQGRLPVVTGGTGLYLKALQEGLSPIPDVPQEKRTEAMQLYKEQGAGALKERDPAMADRLKEGDTQRHTRALEVWLTTGKSLAYWQEQPRMIPFADTEFSVEVITLDRDELYRRCDARFMVMLEQGALEEVKSLKAQSLSPSLPAMRAVGVPELMAYLDGQRTLDQAAHKARQATRNYAKRQLTWFRHQISEN
jgi:tRNA dimethylallyltransferase